MTELAEERSISEFWEGKFVSPHMDSDLTRRGESKIKVTGHKSTRTVIEQAGFPFMLAEQDIDYESAYVHEVYLTEEATLSAETLFNEILAQPPLWTEAMFPEVLGWEAVALGLSKFALAKGVFEGEGGGGGTKRQPFQLEGYHAFGTEDHITSGPNWTITGPRSVEEVHDENKTGDECKICYERYADWGDTLMMPCLHVYHKSCLFGWFWRSTMSAFHNDENREFKASCPECNMTTC